MTYNYALTFHSRKELERILNDYEIEFERISTPYVCNCKEDWTDGTGWCENCKYERYE